MKKRFLVAFTLVSTIAMNMSSINLIASADEKNSKESLVNEKDVQVGDEVTYRIAVQVPNKEKLTKLAIVDPLASVLEYKSAKVFNEKGEDITNSGNLKYDDKNHILRWEAKNPGEYFGEVLALEITVKLKSNVDYDNEWFNKDTGQYEIPNIATLEWNDHSTPTEEVVVKPPKPIESSVTKKVGLTEGDLKDHLDVGYEKNFKYTVDFQIPSLLNLRSVVLYDDLEDVLDLKGVEIWDLANNKNITNDPNGKLEIDNQKEIFTYTFKDVKKLEGSKYQARITASIKDVPELEKYMQDGRIVINNVAEQRINEEPKKSKPVTVSPPLKKAKVTKSIVNPDVKKTEKKSNENTKKSDNGIKTSSSSTSEKSKISSSSEKNSATNETEQSNNSSTSQSTTKESSTSSSTTESTKNK